MTVTHALPMADFSWLFVPDLVIWLNDGQEIALLDVREYGQYGEGHPFFAVNVPYSCLEVRIGALVPRLNVRIVLLDDGDGVAQRAAVRLQQLGYRQVHILAGGVSAWSDAGQLLFKGVNLPSKTFGELVEQVRHTPCISASELSRRRQSGEQLVLIDGRTLEEHRMMTIPGSLPIPNGELALRIESVLPNEQTPVVVHCAGRTRSIIGAQTLIELGVPNPVFALENGTQGWRLAGFDLEYGSMREVPKPVGVTHICRLDGQWLPGPVAVLSERQAQAWLDDASRTTYVLDVRSVEEYASGSLAGARHAPGGQLIQATDQTIAVRNSRVILLDGDGKEGVRAPIIAGWLLRLGFETATVEHGVLAELHVPAPAVHWRPSAQIRLLQGEMLRAALKPGACILDLRSSVCFRQAHPEGARWSIRPRLVQALGDYQGAIILVADGHETAEMAAGDLKDLGVIDVAWFRWKEYERLGLPVACSGLVPSDEQSIDYLFFVHDRHTGNLDAARQYLAWETGLINQCSTLELSQFQLG